MYVMPLHEFIKLRALEPHETLLRDRPMLMTGVLYLATAIFVLIGHRQDWLPSLLQ